MVTLQILPKTLQKFQRNFRTDAKKMKEKVIENLEYLGFVTVCHKSFPREIYIKDDIAAAVGEQKYKI
ncbi:MAG: hypothetical protein JSW60_09550 [Thermoplasmatales archaeon]|nr:MAG: hypothetical protein JSW60_09550 [Thermoplasmatales archaeon]